MPDSEIPKTGIIPVGGTTAGPLHDRSAGGLIGTLIAFAIIHFSGKQPDQGQAAAIYGSTATLGTMLGAVLPDAARPWIQALLGVLAAVVGAGVLSGCAAGTDLRPQALCLQAAGAYRPVQVIAAAALHTDKLPLEAVQKIQAVDLIANEAAHACKTATTPEDVAYSTGVLTGAALQLPALTTAQPAQGGGK